MKTPHLKLAVITVRVGLSSHQIPAGEAIIPDNDALKKFMAASILPLAARLADNMGATMHFLPDEKKVELHNNKNKTVIGTLQLSLQDMSELN